MKVLLLKALDGSHWHIPLSVIAESRAKVYAPEFGGDLRRSLDEDTIPLFESDDYAAEDWAKNNMNWRDVRDQAVKVKEPDPVNMADSWLEGEMSVVERSA